MPHRLTALKQKNLCSECVWCSPEYPCLVPGDRGPGVPLHHADEEELLLHTRAHAGPVHVGHIQVHWGTVIYNVIAKVISGKG